MRRKGELIQKEKEFETQMDNIKKEIEHSYCQLKDENNEKFKPYFTIDKFTTVDISKDFSKIFATSKLIRSYCMDNSYIYAYNYDNKFQKIDKSNFSVMCESGVISNVSLFRLDDDFIYVYNDRLKKLDKNNLEIISESSSISDVLSFTIDDDFIYIYSKSKLMKYEKSTLRLVETINRDSEIRVVHVDNIYIYVCGYYDICKYDKSNFSLVATTSRNTYISNFSQDEKKIYICVSGNIEKVNKNNLTTENVYTDSSILNFVMDNEYIYANKNNYGTSNTLVKLNKEDFSVIKSRTYGIISFITLSDNYISTKDKEGYILLIDKEALELLNKGPKMNNETIENGYIYYKKSEDNHIEKCIISGITKQEKYYNGETYLFTQPGIKILDLTYKIKEFRRVN